MVRLKQVLKKVKYKNRPNDLNLNIKNLSSDSKKTEKDGLFIAIKGRKIDGHDFISEAISKGAKVIVCEKDFRSSDSVTKIIVDDARRTLSILAKNFYKTNLEKVRLIGITGTNGKTTISLLIESILSQANFKTTLIGTLGYRQSKDRFVKLNNTTPGALELHNLCKNSRGYVIMEVSSHALSQYRVKDLKFRAAVFSNLSAEHLDYHKDMKDYLKAKSRLFSDLSSKSLAVINKDDKNFKYLKSITKARVFTYSIKNRADFTASDIKLEIDRSHFLLKSPSGEISIKTKLIGLHNIYNILAASSLTYHEGIKLKTIKKGIENLKVIPGRLETIYEKQPFRIFIDYAHTPDALENVLGHLKKLLISKNKIFTVFGCGGDRDKKKRPKMARKAKRYSDFIILTNDNPRTENPLKIIKDIKKGFTGRDSKRYSVILDRKKAIEEAFNLACDNDIVLIAGKGHEDRQIFRNRVVSFDDRKVSREILRKKIKKS